MRSDRRIPFRNFGDELSPLIVEAIARRSVSWSSAQSCDLVAIGSILHLLPQTNRSALIWGSGLRSPKQVNELGRDRMLAVRGPETSRALGIHDTLITHGDPGLLSHLVIQPNSKLSGKTLFIPHFSEELNRTGRRNIEFMNTIADRVVSPSEDPKSVLREIANSQLVYSSSLHGLVCAFALGVPAIWVDAGLTSEADFKFEDFYMSLGIPTRKTHPRHLASAEKREQLLTSIHEDMYSVHRRVQDISQNLIKCFEESPAYNA